MRIDGIVTCVGEKFTSILSKALPIWAKTLDSITVVTDKSTHIYSDPPIVFYEGSKSKITVYRTDLFTQYGAFFNKGAGLSSAYQWLNPTDWVLHFDADVIPPSDWRGKIEPLIRVGYLYGAARAYEDGTLISDPGPPFPYGFFHLWNARDPRSWVRPLWDLFWPSAGHYEVSFLNRWPDLLRAKLPLVLTHPCEPRTGWFGETPEGKRLMQEDARMGHVKPRELKLHALQVPDFKMRVCFATEDPELALELMKKNTTTDPFETYVRIATTRCPLL